MKVCPPKAHAIGFAAPLPYFSKNWKLIMWLLCPRQPPAITSHQSFTVPKQQVQSGAFLSWLPHQLCHSRNLLDDLKDEHCSGEDSLCSQDLSSPFFETFPDRNPQLPYCSPRPVSPSGNRCPYWSTCHCGPGVTVSSGITTCLGG